MPKTQHLKLNLTDEAEEFYTAFGDWRQSIDGNNDETQMSNFQIIDDAFGTIETALDGIIEIQDSLINTGLLPQAETVKF